MSEELETTSVDYDESQPVTEAENAADVADNSEASTPVIENRDGKLYIEGIGRLYTREDTSRIAANARKEAEAKILGELQVESFDQVKTVISQLQEAGDTEETLSVQSLRDAVKKREEKVEELRAQLQSLKQETVLKDHIGQLQNAMPSQWNADQKAAVLDLMRARDMLQLEGDTFAIRNGDSFITDESGEKPDYAAAVTMMGKALGLPMAKSGVNTFETADKQPEDGRSANKPLDMNRMKSDAAYRSAYVQLRNKNKSLSHGEITDAMVRKQIDGPGRGSLSQKALTGSATKPTARKSRR